MSVPRQHQIEAPVLPQEPIGIEFAIAKIQEHFKRIAPKPIPQEHAYNAGIYTIHFTSHMEEGEEIVDDISCYTYSNDGQQVSFAELQDKGYTVADALKLQDWLHDQAWETEQE